MHKSIRAIGVAVLAAVWLGLTLFAWFSPEKALSQAERRPLQQRPELSADAVLSGSFAEKFETYTLDQFPLRDAFRTVKSLYVYHALQQKDNNGIYIANGFAVKLEYPVSSTSVSHALRKMNAIYDQYLQNTDSRIFLTVVPDKGYYLAAQNGYPAMDYGKLLQDVASGAPWAQTVDITNTLSEEHYYRTDTHWRQEMLSEAADILCQAMGVERARDLTPVLATDRFYGVYYWQAALPMQADALYIMESPWLQDCRVYNYETKRFGPVYDREKMAGMDPYEVYLSGSQALLRVENPHGKAGKELIVFRDSFASALVPWLMQDYQTVTLVDIRYISAALLGEYLDFHGQDVLFAYSTLILNSSASMK